MNIMSKINNIVRHYYRIKQQQKYSQFRNEYNIFVSLLEINSVFKDRNSIYSYMHHCFHHNCPKLLHNHRDYFSKEQRGFGEDAFHAMWYLLLREFRPNKCLEIGVYRGQVISLWALISKIENLHIEVHGISPFTPVGDQVSIYNREVDYYKDVLASFEYFDLPTPKLVRALSTDQIGIDHVKKNTWDLIYIDGGHDFETALADYQLCKDYLSPNGILVLDDASLWTEFSPPIFSFAGHPGPSRVAREYADKEMRLICAVGHNNIYQRT